MTVTGQLLMPCTQRSQDRCDELTSFLIQLFQHLADDLANTLKCLDVLFRDIKLPRQILDTHTEGLQLCFPFSKLEQAPFIIFERLLPLGIAGAVHGGRRTRFAGRRGKRSGILNEVDQRTDGIDAPRDGQ